jgi:uncharacterized protein
MEVESEVVQTDVVVAEFLARNAACDLSVVQLFDDEIDFFAPGDPEYFPWAGHHTRGGEELAAVFEKIWASRTPGKGHVARSKLVVQGEDAVWIGLGAGHEIAGSAPNAGGRFTIDVAILFTVSNGKIVRLHVIEDMTSVAQAYGYS